MYEEFIPSCENNTETYMIVDLENKALIEKYEELGIEINKIFIELVSRFRNKELTEEEYSLVIDISSRRGSELVDYLNMSKNDIKEGFSKVADILSDENR